MKFRPAIAPTIFTIVAFLLLAFLGTWQVQRLLWKNQLIDEIQNRASMPQIELPSGHIDATGWLYRVVAIKGHFLHGKEIHLFTGAREIGGEPGYNILTPLQTDTGGIVLVDRGWVPAPKKEQEKRPETLVSGEVDVTGMIIAGEKKGLFTPNNDTIKNLWFWIDMPAVATFTGNELDNVYVRELAGKNQLDALPIRGDSQVKIRNDHLEYALTWYSLAIILLVIYFIYVKKQSELENRT